MKKVVIELYTFFWENCVLVENIKTRLRIERKNNILNKYNLYNDQNNFLDINFIYFDKIVVKLKFNNM